MFVTPELERCVGLAAQLAMRFRHEYLLPEHLLWVLMESSDPVIANSVVDCGTDVKTAQDALRYFMNRVPATPSFHPNEQPLPSLGMVRLLDNANKLARSRLRNSPKHVDLWVSALEDTSLDGTKLLNDLGITALKVKHFLSHGSQPQQAGALVQHPEASVLSAFAICLTDQASQSKLDPVAGRDLEVEATALDLLRRRKRNVLLVGEAGVGKTAVVEGLAQAIVEKKTPEALHTRRIWSLDAGSLISGTRFRGDFEERMKKIIAVCETTPDVILFIDEIHTLIGMGSGGHSAMDAANFLKPALARGQLQLIGATTEQESRQILEKDRALKRRFIRRFVSEPTAEVAVLMVQSALPALAKHHHVEYDPSVAEAAVSLAKEHVRDLKLPDSALDLLDHAGSRHQRAAFTLFPEHIVDTLSSLLATPIALSKDKHITLGLRERLQSSVFGQDKAVETLYKSMVRAQAGLQHSERPLGSFLFVGATGVGKTELAKQLAVHMGLPLVKFDLSEYQESHSTARLLGSPPGYVGHQEGGQLTPALRKNPSCVILLDEFDKAHPSISRLFLQALNDGVMTDGQGETLDFRKCVLIFTTNLGSDTLEKSSIGFTAKKETFDPTDAIKQALSPEFRNRLTAVVPFTTLNETHRVQVVEKLLRLLEPQLNGRMTLIYDPQFSLDVARLGFDPLMGARPLERWVDEHLKTPLAELLLSLSLKPGETRLVRWDDATQQVQFIPQTS
jgi:ATP-dependent Clp protease ATP-binding subunit ClpA